MNQLQTTNHLCRLPFAALILLLMLGHVPSQGATDSLSAEPRWFSIELIIFKQPVHPSYAEHWPNSAELYFPENLVRFPSESQNNSQPDSFMEVEFDGHLQAAKQILERERGQRVLFTRRWQQGLLDKENAPYIYIRGGEKSGRHRELEGSIQISVERYLHIKANMWLSKFGDASMEATNSDNDTFGDEDDFDDESQTEIRLPEPPFRSSKDFGLDQSVERVFSFSQERRLRSKETHYIDHPALGIVLRIEPME